MTVGVDDRVGTATPDLAAHASGEEREADPALIFEAVALGGIEGERRTVPNRGGDSAYAVEPRGEQATDIEPGKLRGRCLDRAGGLDQREIGGGAECGERAGILAVEFVDDRLDIGDGHRPGCEQ